jgi:AbiV family abortive infection protein
MYKDKNAKTSSPKAVFTKDQLIEGIRLCLLNAERLNTGAETLLENNQSGLAYTLWSLAVEEWGKREMFKERLEENEFSLNRKAFEKIFKEHKAKFNRGFKAIDKSEKHRLLMEGEVIQNNSSVGFKLAEEIFVPAGLSGKFSQLLKPDVGLRMRQFYVGFDPDKSLLTHPFIPEPSMGGEVMFGETSLKEGIQLLKDAIAQG